ncbi:assimilatory sulfite reductase (NADPH) hemoprotein subunit [Paenibacillus sp. JDR-2]|uniref:Sulfite reductase [NADPH] hemoprotein beta-component n=1 Tax=Paenibacillus sp. (strain JDR-2) TaxID=324057 RepID=CYSI_PAESJ|nr:assimilatory sulfite reductase (NADPH) hemoprotein subunit [Paenibacillus sp. JDR-2]C6CXN6.1 RecName: Full=Sulfite reductase [NADPH] hemoprotein beta-component; Short=SiR-HP; Short=SiRHP [Paenibacillus sp. JDR-2]ACT00449.1 sulfite reductase (NADPH) hemoprotein, beta-component [Paenibacillus sp. JDR-2]
MAKNHKVEPVGGPPSDVEHLKLESNYLRGSLTDSLANRITGGLPDLDNRLLKFHGSYMQDDRDYRNEREKQKLEPYYQFMLRVVTPGGVATPEQWLLMDSLADKYGTGSLKLTTRQAFQLHGVLKWNLKKTIQEINAAMLSTLAACGDVSRNVMCNPNPYQSELHSEVFHWSQQLTSHLAPKTPAYHEIWLDGEKVVDGAEQGEVEPIYGPVYLPRKFKIGIAVPPSNDVDVYSQDLGYIAILGEDGKLAGFNVCVGGGMGMTHGDTATYPQLAKVIGFVTPDQVLDLAEKVVTIQRDYGNRSVRKYARFKYTIDRHGLPWFMDELQDRLGWELAPAREFHFEHTGDRYGWIKGKDGKWNLNLYVQAGRVVDTEDNKLRSALREIAKIHTGDFRLTANQNLVIANVTAQKKTKIVALLKEFGIAEGSNYSALRRSALSCVALPTCGLAMAEAERYLPSLIDRLEPILANAGLQDQEINIRMTGCPNGCARPALGEISFIGKSPGKYNMYMGAGFTGDRLSKMYKENIGEDEIIDTLTPIIDRYASERNKGENFGDFVIRAGYVKAVTDGTNFHD